MKKFLIQKDNSLKVIFLLLFLFFIVFYIVLKDIFFLFLSIAFVIGYIAVYGQRDIIVEADESGLKITKLRSKILGQSVVEIPYTNISRITKNSSKNCNFSQIITENGKSYFIPLERNVDFDKFIFELDIKLRNENKNYNSKNTEKDKKAEIYKILFIFTLILSIIIDTIVFISFPNLGEVGFIFWGCSFIIPFIFCMLFVNNR